MRTISEVRVNSNPQEAQGSNRAVYAAADRDPQPVLPEGRFGVLRKSYTRFPKVPLEWKIETYVRLLNEGWGRNYARAEAGLKCGRLDYKAAMTDPRVIQAHERNRQAFIEKQRGKLG